MQITLLSIVVVFFLYVLLYVLLHVFPLPCESMKPQSVGDANRCMHTRDVPSRLGSSASPETCEPLSRPCLLYEKTYVKFVSVSVSTIQF